MRRHRREWSVLLVLAGMLGVLWLAAPDFFKTRQLLSLATATSPVLVAAMGVSMVLLCRQIDISIGSQFALCSVFVGLAAQRGWGPGELLALAMGGGGLMGAMNGALVAGAGVPSIVGGVVA